MFLTFAKLGGAFYIFSTIQSRNKQIYYLIRQIFSTLVQNIIAKAHAYKILDKECKTQKAEFEKRKKQDEMVIIT